MKKYFFDPKKSRFWKILFAKKIYLTEGSTQLFKGASPVVDKYLKIMRIFFNHDFSFNVVGGHDCFCDQTLSGLKEWRSKKRSNTKMCFCQKWSKFIWAIVKLSKFACFVFNEPHKQVPKSFVFKQVSINFGIKCAYLDIVFVFLWHV